MSDNGPQFSGKQFQDFAKQYGFEHVTSSPGFPQSNGKAEKAVQIVKRLFTKAKECDSDPYLALLNYRATPLTSEGESPDEISRKGYLRTHLPCAEDHNITFKDRKPSQKSNYDRGSKRLESIEPRDTVRVRKDGVWSERATVLAKVAPNSYDVLLEKGKVLRRNRRHLLKTNETFTPMPQKEDDASHVVLRQHNEEQPAVPTKVPITPGEVSAKTAPSRNEQTVKLSDGPPAKMVPSRNEQTVKLSDGPPAVQTRSGRVVNRPSRYDQ